MVVKINVSVTISLKRGFPTTFEENSGQEEVWDGDGGVLNDLGMGKKGGREGVRDGGDVIDQGMEWRKGLGVGLGNRGSGDLNDQRMGGRRGRGGIRDGGDLNDQGMEWRKG